MTAWGELTSPRLTIGLTARGRPPSHATHNEPGILVLVTFGSFFGSCVAILGPGLVCELLDQVLRHGAPQASPLEHPGIGVHAAASVVRPHRASSQLRRCESVLGGGGLLSCVCVGLFNERWVTGGVSFP